MTAPAARPARQPSTTFRIGWLTILVVTVAMHAWTSGAWSWFQDDLLFTSQVPERGFLDFMFHPVADHLAPGTLGLIWLVASASPLGYGWAVVVMCLFAGASVVAWGLALREIFGERPQVLAGLVLVSLTPGLLMDSLFWSRGLGTWTTLISMGLALWFLARMLVRGAPSLGDLVGMTLSYALGLFMWEKCLLVTIPLLFLCLLLGPRDLRGALRSCVRHLWPVAIVTAIYVPVFLLVTSGSSQSDAGGSVDRTFGAVLAFFASGLVDVALPWMVGGPFSRPESAAGSLPHAAGAVALGLFAITVVLVILALRHRRRGWLALLMVVVYAAFAWGLVLFSNRFGFAGGELIRSPHYTADLLPVMVLAATFLVTRTVLDEETPLRRPVDAAVMPWVRRGAIAYLALVCVVATTTTGRLWDKLEPTSPKPYLDTLTGQAERLGNAVVYDARIPQDIVNPVFLNDGSLVSDVLRPLDLPLRYDEPTTRFITPDSTGAFREAEVTGGATNSGPGPSGLCGYAVEPGGSTTIPLDQKLFDFSWGMEITYFTGSDATIAVRTDDDVVKVDLPRNKPGGVGKRQLVINGPVTRLTLDFLDGPVTVCVGSVRIGNLTPTTTAPSRLSD